MNLSAFVETINKNKLHKDFINLLNYIASNEISLTQTDNICLKNIKEFAQTYLPDDYQHYFMKKYSFRSQYEWSYFDFIITLAEIMKLTRKRSKKLFISSEGKKFLADSPDNQHSLMFCNYYFNFNWCYLFPYTETEEENPARHLQETKDFVLREILDYPVDPDNFIDFKSFAAHIRNKFNLKMFNYRNDPLPDRIDDCLEHVLLDYLMDFGFLEYHICKEKRSTYDFEYMDNFKITTMGKLALDTLSPERLDTFSRNRWIL